MSHLLPYERLAVTVARAQVGRGDNPAINTTAMLLMIIDRLATNDGPPCCDLHNRNCEPPSELCCWACTEANHPKHLPRERCVTSGGAS